MKTTKNQDQRGNKRLDDIRRWNLKGEGNVVFVLFITLQEIMFTLLLNFFDLFFFCWFVTDLITPSLILDKDNSSIQNANQTRKARWLRLYRVKTCITAIMSVFPQSKLKENETVQTSYFQQWDGWVWITRHPMGYFVLFLFFVNKFLSRF